MKLLLFTMKKERERERVPKINFKFIHGMKGGIQKWQIRM